MSAALPSVPIVTGEYRALMIYEAAPLDCGALLVPDDRFAPHLKAGELAVVDPDDDEPMAGEIYVVKISSPRHEGGYVLRFAQLRSSQLRFGRHGADGQWRPDPDTTRGWWMHFSMMRPRPRPAPRSYGSAEEAACNISPYSLCDGPLGDDGMRRYIVGRVIGVLLG